MRFLGHFTRDFWRDSLRSQGSFSVLEFDPLPTSIWWKRSPKRHLFKTAFQSGDFWKHRLIVCSFNLNLICIVLASSCLRIFSNTEKKNPDTYGKVWEATFAMTFRLRPYPRYSPSLPAPGISGDKQVKKFCQYQNIAVKFVHFLKTRRRF